MILVLQMTECLESRQLNLTAYVIIFHFTDLAFSPLQSNIKFGLYLRCIGLSVDWPGILFGETWKRDSTMMLHEIYVPPVSVRNIERW